MDYDPNAWSTGSQHDRQGRPRTFNQWGGPFNPGSVAFTNPDPFAHHHPDLSLNTHLSGAYPPQQDNATTPTPFGPESIKHWVTSEDSWNAASLTAPRLDTSAGQSQHHYQAFAVPRSPARSASTASVVGPPKIDSAYCSNASPSTNEPATAGSDCAEFTSFFGKMSYPISNASETPATPIKTQTRRGPTSVPSQAGDHETPLPEDGKCQYCKKEFRLKSELKKHTLRHTRPFRCQIPACTGMTEGFTTCNDLDRHNRSVHGIFPRGAKIYVCAAPNCAEGEKTWPRYDNFKQHCERMHKDEKPEILIRRSERQAPLPPSEVQQHLPEYNNKPGAGRKRSAVSDTASLPPREAPGYTSPQESQESAFYQYPVSDNSSWAGYHSYSDLSDDPSTRVAQRQVRSHFQGGRGMTRGDAASMSSGRFGSRSTGKAPQIVLHQPEQGQKQRQNELAHMRFDQEQTESPIEYFQEHNFGQHHPRAQSAGNLLTPNMARSRSLSSQSSNSSQNNAARGRAATISGGDTGRAAAASKRRNQGASPTSPNPKRVRCQWPGCTKTDMRPCELKKHERRHSRPFGCTFESCHKAFGSKNDWKRHETSQHFQEEMWRCGQIYQPSAAHVSANGVMTLNQSECETSKPCALVFYEQQDMESHLTDEHGVTDPTQIKTLCATQRIGRNQCGSFWCGFCKAVLPLEHEGRKGWDERFDHIGNHFHPGGLKIKDWVPAIGNKTKGQLLEEKQSQNWDSESRSDVDAAGDTDVGTSFSSSVVHSPVVADTAPFTSPVESFGGHAMTGLEFAGMGPQPLQLNTAFPMNGLGTYVNGQLLSPAASGSQDACTKKHRFSTPELDRYCCQCGDGPMEVRPSMGCACMTCGHNCEAKHVQF